MKAFTACCALLFFFILSTVEAATIVVNTLSDAVTADGFCSLREAIQAANTNAPVNECASGQSLPADVIDLTGLSGNIALSFSTELLITEDVTINGPGAKILSITGNGNRVFETSSLNATISGLKITGGANSLGGGILVNSTFLKITNCWITGNSCGVPAPNQCVGGGIANVGGIVILDRSTVSNNVITANAASDGGGIVNAGFLIATNSTIAGNSALATNGTAHGGGIHNIAILLSIVNCTISGNTAADGGGIYDMHTGTDPVELMTNTILSGNFATANPDASIPNDPLTSGGSNILGTIPFGNYLVGPNDQLATNVNLGPLQDNGGQTPTMELLPGSSAVDAAVDSVCAGDPIFNVDQRGNLRPVDGDHDDAAHCDIGAFEAPPTCLFCEDFSGSLANWTVLKPDWNNNAGALNAVPKKKAEIVAQPGFAGCDNCSFQADITIPTGKFTRLWLLAHYSDEKNMTQLLLKGGTKAILKEISGGHIVAKANATITFTPNVPHTVNVTYNGTQYEAFIDGVSILTLVPKRAVLPGTIGFEAKKKTTAVIDNVDVR